MAIRTGNRFRLSRVALVAAAEAKLAARAAPNAVRRVAPIVAWGAASILLGLVVGLASVALPPLAAIGIVAIVALVLLWVMPELPLVWPGLIRKAFYVTLIVDLSVPSYYTIDFPGLPWISIRRIATFTLIAPFVLAIAASSDVRRQIADHARDSSRIIICAVGFLVMAALSVITSADPSASFSALIEALLSWYVPFLALIYIVRNEQDLILVLKIICAGAFINTIAGIVEFALQRRVFLDVFPSGMLQSLIASNPGLFQNLLPSAQDFRNGMYRSPSTFMSPLSYGEFNIIIIPIALFFAVYRKNLLEKGLGWALVMGGIAGIYCSGSRGGWVGLLVSMAVFVTIWSLRKAVHEKGSLGPAIVGLAAVVFFTVAIALIIVWPRAHNMVLGGGAQAGSTEARYSQWLAAIPWIKSNPITGHGFVLGGYVINSSIDSYVTSLFVETGVPGFVFFAGLLLIPIWYGLRNCLSDMSERGALAGAVACSLIAFTTNRLVLSERENHMLIFSLLSIVIYLNYDYAKRRVTQRSTPRVEVPRRAQDFGRSASASRG